MSREWKPGDVAMIQGFVSMRFAYSHLTCPRIHSFDGDHWHRANGTWVCNDARAEARPLVVIDPEDRDQVGRLADEIVRSGSSDGVSHNRLAEALHTFAAPQPPRCSAHGDVACAVCSRIVSTALGSDGECRGCSTYGDTGMHWDTCPHRIVGAVYATRSAAIANGATS